MRLSLKLRPSREPPEWSSSRLRLCPYKFRLIQQWFCAVLCGNCCLSLPTPARLLCCLWSMRLLLPAPSSSILGSRLSPVSGQPVRCSIVVRLLWLDLFFRVHCQNAEVVPKPDGCSHHRGCPGP